MMTDLCSTAKLERRNTRTEVQPDINIEIDN